MIGKVVASDVDDVLYQDEVGLEEARSASPQLAMRYAVGVSEGAPRARTRDLLSPEGKEFVSTVWRRKRERDREHVPSEEVWRNRKD